MKNLFISILFFALSHGLQAQADTLFFSFAYGSAELPEALKKTDWSPYYNCHIHAYSSGPGSEPFNRQLSKQRADKTGAWLGRQYPNMRLQIQYFGDAHNPDDADNAAHRGVKIIAYRKKEEKVNIPIPKEEKVSIPKEEKSIEIKVYDIISRSLISNYSRVKENNGLRIGAEGYKDSLVSIPESGKLDVYLTPQNVQKIVRMENLLFYPNSAELLPESKRALDQYLSELDTDSELCFEIHGHVNAPYQMPVQKTPAQLHKLSKDRAFTVFNQMLKSGFRKDKMKFAGYSNTRMIHPYARTEAEMRLNRRVEIIVSDCEK